MPNITDLPLDVVGSVLNDLVLNDGRRAMQYGSGQGEPAIREAICEVMRLENISAHPDDVMVSVGSQQGLDLLTRIFCNPAMWWCARHPATSAHSGSSAPISARSSMSPWTSKA